MPICSTTHVRCCVCVWDTYHQARWGTNRGRDRGRYCFIAACFQQQHPWIRCTYSMAVAPNDSRPLPAASYPLLETLSRVPLTLSPTDKQVSHLSDTSKSQLSADNETLLAALSLFQLAKPVNGRSHQSHCCMVWLFQMQHIMIWP